MDAARLLRESAKLAPGTKITLADGTTPVEPGTKEPEKFNGLDVLLDRAMQAIEDDNEKLKGVLKKN